MKMIEEAPVRVRTGASCIYAAGGGAALARFYIYAALGMIRHSLPVLTDDL